jgi:hypothetical protein
MGDTRTRFSPSLRFAWPRDIDSLYHRLIEALETSVVNSEEAFRCFATKSLPDTNVVNDSKAQFESQLNPPLRNNPLSVYLREGSTSVMLGS